MQTNFVRNCFVSVRRLIQVLKWILDGRKKNVFFYDLFDKFFASTANFFLRMSLIE